MPLGWYIIQTSRSEMEVCSLACLNEVAGNWMRNHRPVERERESAQWAVDDNGM